MLSPNLSPFDPDAVALAHGEVPPPPFGCPTCQADVDDIAFTCCGPMCERCFRVERKAGRNPEIVDPIADVR